MKITTIIKFNKESLFTLFTNRINEKEHSVIKTMSLSSKQLDWFNKNINYTIREVELIMSIISSTLPIYNPDEVIYTINYPKSNDIEHISECMELFFTEKMVERFYNNFTDNEPIKESADIYYKQIKSITLKLSREDYDKFK